MSEKRIIVHKHGGPEVMELENLPLDAPGAGEVRVRHHAIGVNFIDTYFRTGLYPPASLPFTPGNEAAGEVVEVGPGTTGFKARDRVAYTGPTGSYCTSRVIAASSLIALPSSVEYDQAAAMMLKGMTAQYLLRQTFRVDEKTTLLFHAAAGGVGSIACAWAKKLGAKVIGTAGSEAKAARAKALGCDHVILYRDEDFVAKVLEFTDGKKCDVVYDAVGKSTFPASLDCLKPRGLFVSFGNASGAVDAFSLGLLAQKGSLYVTRPTLASYASDPARANAMAKELFEVLSKGWISVDIDQKFALADAQEAHRKLESRQTVGSTILTP